MVGHHPGTKCLRTNAHRVIIVSSNHCTRLDAVNTSAELNCQLLNKRTRHNNASATTTPGAMVLVVATITYHPSTGFV